MRECHALGSNVILITKEKMANEDWPRDILADLFVLPNDAPVELFLDLVSHIGSNTKPDRIVALEEFDVVVAALAREHLCLPGLSSVTAIAATYHSLALRSDGTVWAWGWDSRGQFGDGYTDTILVATPTLFPPGP